MYNVSTEGIIVSSFACFTTIVFSILLYFEADYDTKVALIWLIIITGLAFLISSTYIIINMIKAKKLEIKIKNNSIGE